MSFFDECENHFKTKDLYEILNVSKDANEKEIKKAYHKMSLKTHPDRAEDEEKENATTKFQILGKVYSVLSNKEKRLIYDETGSVDDDINESISDWLEYWRSLFPRLTKDRIVKAADEYRNSGKEKEDLKKAYLEHKGNLNKIVESVLFCDVLEDEPRYKKIIREWIDNKEVPSYKSFTNEPKSKTNARRRKYMKEKNEVEEMAAMKDLNGSVGSSKSSLEDIIARRTQERRKMQDSFLSDLEAKYCKPKKAKTSAKNTKVTKKTKA